MTEHLPLQPARYDHRFLLGPHGPLAIPLQNLLRKNAGPLRDVGAEFAKPKHHRDVLNTVLKMPIDELLDPATHQTYVDMVLNAPDARRVIYSYDAFFGSRKNALSEDFVYPSLEKKIYPLRHLVMGQKVTVYLCLQHFTRFVENELANAVDMDEVVQSYPAVSDFSWVRLVWRLRDAWPEALIVVIDETTLARRWAVIATLICGHPNTQDFKQIEAYPASCLNDEGRTAYSQALTSSPPDTLADWVAVTERTFDAFAVSEQQKTPAAASPWSAEQFQHSQSQFEADLKAMSELDNVVLARDFNLEFE